MKIEFVSDVACPWCAIGLNGLERALERIDGDIDQRARSRFVETGWRKLAEMDSQMTVDNFEGIAVKEMPDGRTRLFIVSDDNFSPAQRTLLMVFDLPKPLR